MRVLGHLITNPKTEPPDPSGRYVPVMGTDGQEQWVELVSDADDTVDADFDFKSTSE